MGGATLGATRGWLGGRGWWGGSVPCIIGRGGVAGRIQHRQLVAMGTVGGPDGSSGRGGGCDGDDGSGGDSGDSGDSGGGSSQL